MLDFYSWKTPNGHKVAIMLEETKLPYTLHTVDISQQEQFNPDYLKINPNNKIPAIVDKDEKTHQSLTIFESGAILIYLAEKSGQFLSKDPVERIHTIQWLMFQMAGVGPMLGQVHHFLHFAPETIPYGIERYTNEAKRLYKVMNTHLAGKDYFVQNYSIADIAIFPWVHLYEQQDIDLNDYPNVKRWHDAIALRPAVQKGLNLI
ncbi:MAG: glutathione S-transferase N-terminal domain-containing protein [Gammaproteobacteria bacterium]